MSDTIMGGWDAGIDLPEPRKNKPLTLGRRIQAGAFFGLMAIMKRLSVEKASASLGNTMRVVGPLIHKVHKRGEMNLRLIYPDMTAAERSAILRDAWENIGRTFAEYAHIDALAERTIVENEELLEPYATGGRQAIFVSGHFANWEAMGAAIRVRGVKFALVYRAPNNALVDEFIINSRARTMSRFQIPKGKRGGRDLVKAVKDGCSLTMLLDQKLNTGIEAPFLGHPAMTAPAAARLAMKQGLDLVPIQLTRRPGANFVMTVHEPINQDGKTGDELTTEINEILGSFVLARPEQWLWFHRRWPAELTPS